MADEWRLVAPTGDLDLNPTFHSPTLLPGEAPGRGAERRDDSGSYQRVGDGGRLPGPLVLEGRVWSDAGDVRAVVEELNAIRLAAKNCAVAIRSNNSGTFTYVGLEGGPEPEIVPDGLGGWSVTIQLWPSRPEPAFRSAALNNLRPRVAVRAEFLSGALRDIVQRAELPELGVTLTPEFLSGALEEPVVERELPQLNVALEPEFHSGSFRDVVVRPPELPQEVVELSSEFHAGSLDQIGVKRTITPTVTLEPEFIGGTLEEA